MDNQVFEMLSKRFDSQDETLKEIKEAVKDHIEKDAEYWRKIDVQEGQVTILKKLILGIATGFATIISAIWAWFGK